MPAAAKLGKRERPSKSWSGKVAQNLLSQITWLDFLSGLGLTFVMSFLLIGFRYQAVPDFKVGEIANQDFRALQDLSYEDTGATQRKRQAARASVPNLYELDNVSISNRESEISKAFSTARSTIAERRLNPRQNSGAAEQTELLRELQTRIGSTLSPDILPVLLRQRFNPILEGQILKVLDTALRNGIVLDRAQFLKDQRSGGTLRDGSRSFERPLTDAYMARDLPTAREYVRQFHLEFSTLSAHDRNELVNFLERLLIPTLTINEKETGIRRDLAASRVDPVEVHIQQGQAIVRSGEQVTQNTLSQLEALKNLQKPRSMFWQGLGFLFFTGAFAYALWRYFVHYQDRHQKIRNHTVLILSIVICVLAVMRLATALADILSERLSAGTFRDPSSLYFAVPFAFGSILVTLLVDVNLAICVSTIVATLAGLFYGDIYIASYALIGSLTGVYSIRQYRDRAAILKAGLTIGLVNALGLIAIDFLRQMPVNFSAMFDKLGFAFLSGILSSALASMLLPALESLFKITTDIRLLELSNLNAPILRRLSVEAPGTYHHSLMVGTLAESAAEAVGANPLLVRVAAYYHDLGKMLKPEYFVENQIFGINKHETLSPSMSCLIIASHVKDGLELAREIGLAQRIADMIPQHHGTRIMTYFYQKAKDSIDAKNQEIVEADFRYPGPKPQSKEAAIMMMADSVEAASRTLTNPTPTQIQGMINRLVDAIVADNQFDECDITLREVRLVKESFSKILTGIYHRRIDYPGYDFTAVAKEPEKVPVPSPSPRPAKAI